MAMVGLDKLREKMEEAYQEVTGKTQETEEIYVHIYSSLATF
jgi:hypothetical protein